MSSTSHIYSPQTTGVAAGEMALANARSEIQQELVLFKQKMQQEQARIDREQREVEAAKAAVRQSEADNWLETTRIDRQRVDLENKVAVIQRDKGLLDKRDMELKLQEDQRRRNRSVSVAFIEDTFPSLSPRVVLENLTNSSSRIRSHAMDNVSACIGGFKETPPTFVRFTPQDIAPDLLPKLHQLVSTSKRPLDNVIQFAEQVVSAPPVAKALALSGQCSRLADFLIETNEFTSQLAVCSFRRMVGMETSVVKPAYEALSQAIPHIPLLESELVKSSHPAIDFVKEVAPKIMEDCFNNGLWSAIAPLVNHRITSIRKVVLHKVILLTQHSDRNQLGLVEANTLALLDPYYQSPTPPPDIIDFFESILPSVAEKLCHRLDGIQWLLVRLSDPSPKINAAVITALRVGVVKQNPTVLQMFVKAELLKKLSEPPTQQSFAISKLICDLLPVLAVLYARVKAAEGIVAFLDHGDTSVAAAGLQACTKIVDSTAEDRAHLYSVISKLNFAKASTLKLYDHAMPAFCKDWVASGDFKMIVQFIQHSEQRIRLPALRLWCDIICNSPSYRPKIVHDGLLDVMFVFCNSQYDDVVDMSAKCFPPMAIEITKAGVSSTQQLVELLSHTFPSLRQAALQAVQIASEASEASCKVLLDAGVFKALTVFFETFPKELPQNAYKALTRLAPFINTSSEACAGLLQLLESGSSIVEHAARSALTTISILHLDARQTLRFVVLTRLTLPTEALIEYSTKAIRDWIGPDLAQINDFTTFFGLISHSDRRIQTAALTSLRQRLSNSDHQESLEKADVVVTIRTLADNDNPEALNFVLAALPILALSLARNGHSSTIIGLLMHKEPKVREGAAAALEAIANGSVQERKRLLEEDIIERLTGHERGLEQTQLTLLSSVIPKLAIDYLNAGKMDLILTLVDHHQQQIRTAATKSAAIIAGGTSEQRGCLRDALLLRLDRASPLLRGVAASCFSRSLAHDLVVDGDFIRLFRIFQNEDGRVREPIITELRNHIQGSDEAKRRHLVDAGILQAILQTQILTKDDLLSFLTTFVLPILGPSFTQNNGGSALFSLLTDGDSRIRTAAIQALKNAMDSRHGNIENMAKAGVIEILYPLAQSDDAVRDFWCRILPKVAPFLENRAEVDILFASLNNTRQNIREAAAEALTIMAKTSEATRGHIFPALLINLENPSPDALPLIAKAISLSGSAFVSSGKESELKHFILNGAPEITAAAVDATIQLLVKGTSFERQSLFDADIFYVALELHDRRSERKHSLKLLDAIVSHLSYEILSDVNLARDMISLFDDPEPYLSSALYQTWTSDSRVYQSHVLPELLPLLFEKLDNQSVTSLLHDIAPYSVPQLVSRRKLDVIVKALNVTDINVIQVFLQETCARIKSSNETEKDWFLSEPSFVSVIGKHLKGRDTTMRRHASTIIDLLSKGSQSRSGKIMNHGIGRDLSWIALNGEKTAKQSSLDALLSLFMAAPDHADRFVSDSLPNLCDILREEGQVVGVYEKAFRLLIEIVEQSSHSVVIKSDIVFVLVKWLSPRHSTTDRKCKSYVFDICQRIAQNSDDGRQALVEAGVLSELSSLTTSQTTFEVVGACKILKALAHSGICRSAIISAGLKKNMENIISPFRKSTLQSKSKEDKQRVQASAKEVLETLKSSKGQNSTVQTNTDPQLLHRAPRRSVPENELPEAEPYVRSSTVERSASESNASPEFSNGTIDRLSEPHEIRHIRHTRSYSESDRPTHRVSGARLSAVREDQVTTVEEENLSSSITRSGTRISQRTLVDEYPRDLRTHTTAIEEDEAGEEDINPRGTRTTPPSYRSGSGSIRGSVSGSIVRRGWVDNS